MRRTVREEKKEMIRRELLSIFQNSNSRKNRLLMNENIKCNRGASPGPLLASLIHSCARDRQNKPANKNSSVELQERGRYILIFKFDSTVLSPCWDYRFGPSYTATIINLKQTKNYFDHMQQRCESRSSPCNLDSFMCARPSSQACK